MSEAPARARTWGLDVPPPPGRPLGLREGLRILRRGLPLALVERPLFGLRRPMTPWITLWACRAALALLGIRRRVTGRPVSGAGAVVSNHAGWLDILALNASQRVCFVSKAEVAGWPGIGWLARAAGTVFIRRDRAEAAAQARLFEDRLEAGHRLLFFPEGTSTDGRRVLPFNSTLFQAFFGDRLRPGLHVQPVTLVYTAPPGEDARFYGWWGEMDFGAHLLQVLAAPRQGTVEVVWHPPVAVAARESRKALSKTCEEIVRVGLEARIGPPPEDQAASARDR